LSLESLLMNKAGDRLSATKDIEVLISGLTQAIKTQTSAIPKFRTFLKSNGANLSSNVADGVIIFLGPKVPAGHVGVVTDLSINFTTAAGTVRISVIDSSGRTVINDISRDLSASASGQATTVLDEGERVAVVGQTAGAGTFGVLVSGKYQKVIEF